MRLVIIKLVDNPSCTPSGNSAANLTGQGLHFFPKTPCQSSDLRFGLRVPLTFNSWFALTMPGPVLLVSTRSIRARGPIATSYRVRFAGAMSEPLRNLAYCS